MGVEAQDLTHAAAFLVGLFFGIALVFRVFKAVRNELIIKSAKEQTQDDTGL